METQNGGDALPLFPHTMSTSGLLSGKCNNKDNNHNGDDNNNKA
eukprot:CAMPEP_0115095094 /NCGR_PEP_ID=MMETSP0227-20121206/28781_1 /TAXON_ID=89957 /ORGANISM="Polarella glacialis, Strain CCMP 1383" /LENGTH=43 /DNA_ID= /DNA_START= /DNA_END= /DNA_ORIENTATION=